MPHKYKLTLLTLAALTMISLFLFYKMGPNVGYVLPKRGVKVFAMIIAGTAIAFSTVLFQTITHNRILTPSIMGLDSLYLLVQTLLVFFIGSISLIHVSAIGQFFLSLVVMVLFSLALYYIMFKDEQRPIFFLLLVGIILGTLFQSLSAFMQVLIDPNEFLIVQDKMFASFNNVQTRLVWLACGIMVIAIGLFSPLIKYLDVLALGRDQAINLGISYSTMVKSSLIIVALLTSLATALVGPITFLGLLVANLAYELLKTYRHSDLFIGAILISIIALCGGQMLVERVFTFSTTLSVIVNFIGGLYFIYLLLRENH